MIYFAPVGKEMMTRIRKDKLLDEQLVRLDALYEYALVHGEKDQAESIRRRMNKLTEKI